LLIVAALLFKLGLEAVLAAGLLVVMVVMRVVVMALVATLGFLRLVELQAIDGVHFFDTSFRYSLSLLSSSEESVSVRFATVAGCSTSLRSNCYPGVAETQSPPDTAV
ncbi:MAG TPA: hypothetical protein VGO93_02485, partial [Candidatus Xenobia bacterium]